MNEETLLARSIEERENIFRKYERGRENLDEIDPWEDPSFEVYTADRYGFMHGQPLPKIPNEDRLLQIERERVKKWLKMIKNWGKVANPEKLERRIFKGIPNSLRRDVWYELLDIKKVKSENAGKYQQMLKLARQWSTDVRQIDSDVNRQFRDHVFYRERFSIKQQSLFNVLCAYGMYNMEVGYCQGMSGLAGMLLLYMDEEESFWALSILLSDRKYAMHGLYIEGFPKLTRFLEHHDKIMNKFLPKLKRHFDKYGLDAILYSLKWFFVCFVERLPFSLCLRIWDLYLMYGERVITAMAFTILRMHKNKLLKLNDMDKLVQCIQVDLYKNFEYSDDITIERLEQNMKELKKVKLDHPGPPPPHELPQRPFGQFVEPDIRTKIGRRAEQFSETEKQARATVIERREKAVLESEDQPQSQSDAMSGGKQDTYGDECTSNLGGSRRSLADTSVTSTADLSVFSSSRPDNSLDTHSNISDGSESVGSGVCGLSIQRAPSTAQSTPRATPIIPSVSPHFSEDVVRIHVTYNNVDDYMSLSNNSLHEHSSFVNPIKAPTSLILNQNGSAKGVDDNRIRIQVAMDELPTPLVDQRGRIKPFNFAESPNEYLDLS